MIQTPTFATKLRKAARDPDMVRRFAASHMRRTYTRYRDWRAFSGPRGRMLAAAIAQAAVPVPHDGPYAIHTLLNASGLQDSLFTLKRLYALLPEHPPLVFHEDGSFRAEHVALVHRNFPGARIILRSDADREVIGELQARGLRRCVELRQQLVLALKLFDLQWYAAGRRVWYVDTDVAHFERPDEILEALRQDDATFVDRYNEDVCPFYTWTPEQVQSAVGLQYPARAVNSGMMAVHRPTVRWDLFEACLELPQRNFYAEQSLWALEFSAGRASALAPEYDVCFRYAWENMDRGACERDTPPGRPVTSQHFCGGFVYQRMFYERMLATAAV